jgi:integrase/recombinase XerD
MMRTTVMATAGCGAVAHHRSPVARSAPTRKRPCKGPLGSYLDGFAKHLLKEGYSPTTLINKRWLVANVSRWLDRRRLKIDDLNEELVRQFHAHRSARGRRTDRITLRELLAYLRDVSCIRQPTAQKADRSALGKLMRDFEQFLIAERALTSSTVKRYLPTVRLLVTHRFKNGAMHFHHLRPRDLHHFILAEERRINRSHAKRTVTMLRSFLQYLLQRGAIQTDLAAGLPTVAHWRLSDLPRSLPADQVERLLKSGDRTSRVGQRDYAILMLLARLGLRAGEVRTLTLDDLDWERGEIVVHGKGQRIERLPLPKDLGEALAVYVRHGRPLCSTRAVFTRLPAPVRALCYSGVSNVVRGALKRAGLNPQFKGAHLLRHSLATSMLRRGATLGEIGQILRHTQPTTTQIYAKVDLKELRPIAPRWMEATS